MTAVDIAPAFVRFAREFEEREPCQIEYLAADALALPFRSRQFAFAAASMSLMDVGEPERALQEACRVLRPGGFLQFSILHPCFMPPHRRLVRDGDGTVKAVEVGRYFECIDGEIDRWIFSAAPPEVQAQFPLFEVPRFHRTLSQWLNAIIDAGFVVERVLEPAAGEETARRVPAVADTRVCGYFLHVRCRKP